MQAGEHVAYDVGVCCLGFDLLHLPGIEGFGEGALFLIFDLINPRKIRPSRPQLPISLLSAIPKKLTRIPPHMPIPNSVPKPLPILHPPDNSLIAQNTKPRLIDRIPILIVKECLMLCLQ